MEPEKKKIEIEKRDNEIVYSRAIKAGKRIYYLDVKRSRNSEMYLAITESKKKFNNSADGENPFTYEKHKIFLYKEDFEKFVDGLEDVIGFIRRDMDEQSQSVENQDEVVGEEKSSDETESKTKSFFDKFRF